MMRDSLDWERDGRDWPHREESRFISAAGFEWHVQQFGSGPALLLLHGTGASTHSWRDLAPILAERFSVIAPDLPGHGFSQSPPTSGLTLPGMASAVGKLLIALGETPRLAIGHSAGAAVLCRMSLDGQLDLQRIVSLNGALLPIPGIAGPLFAPLARALTRNPFVPWLFALRARDPRIVEALLRDTGSTIDELGVRLYGRLASSPRHVRSVLRMMANWDLDSLAEDLPRLACPLTLIVGERDRFVVPRMADRIARRVPHSERILVADAGHLAHEERPVEIARLIFDALARES